MKLNKDQFEAEVLKSSVPVLVDFYADWCGPCKMMAPVVERLAEECGDTLKVCQVNVDEQQELAVEYRVMSIPMLVIFKNGSPVETLVGARGYDDLKAHVQPYL